MNFSKKVSLVDQKCLLAVSTCKRIVYQNKIVDTGYLQLICYLSLRFIT